MKKNCICALAIAALCGCQVEEMNYQVLDSGNFIATIEDDFSGGSKTSLDEYGNVLWKAGDQISIFEGSTINQQYQVTDASEGKTVAGLTPVSSTSFVAGGEIDNNIAYYPYSSTATVARSENGYVISDFVLPATQDYAANSFGNGAFPMAAVTTSASDKNLKFKNILGGLKIQLKGTARIAAISVKGNNKEPLCGAAAVAVSNSNVPSICLTDTSARTVTLECGGVQLNTETATSFVIALPPMTMTAGFTVFVEDTEGKQMKINTTKEHTIVRSGLLKMAEVNYDGSSNNHMSFTSIEYVGSKQRIYDSEKWVFSTFCQWVVELKNEETATNVTLVLNGVKADVKTLNVPAGEYEIDATAAHADKTFSIKSLDGVERKYTTIVRNGREIEIVDGEITVANDGAITAKLYDDPGNTYSFSTVNAAPSVVNNALGAQLQVAYKANYNTYFANNNNEWNLDMYVSEKVSDTTPYLGYLSLNIYGNADGELQPGAFPTGTYTVKASTEKDSGYAAGNVIADPFTIAPSTYNTVVVNADSTTNAKILSGTVAVSKEGELYTFDVKLKMQKWHYDESYDTVYDETFDFNYVFTDVPVIKVDNNGSRPVPDGDIALTQWGMNGGYIGMWFGNSYSLTTNETTPNSVLLIGDTAIEKFNYYFYAILNTSSEWKFEKNYPPKYLYCVNKVPAGEYAFTATKPETASDFLVKNAKKYADYRAIKNNYTGTKFYYDGGKITVTNTDMTFDLTATSAGDEAHGIAPKAIKITGTLPNNVVYFRDYSAANQQAKVAWYTE